MLTDPHALQRKIQSLSDRRARNTHHLNQEQRESRQWIARARENPQVAPGIDVVFDRQNRNIRPSATSAQLSAIRVLFPAHTAQQCTIRRMKGDEITAAAMIGTEHEFP